MRIRQLAIGAGIRQAPAGSTMRAALVADIADTWHLYWQNPGDAGLPPEVTWTSDATLSAWDWPVPKRSIYSDLATLGYEGRLILPITITLPEAATEAVSITGASTI